MRLNLSKSGLGYSLGVRGARIGLGPRGNYVRLGRGGVYYQKYLSTTHSDPTIQPFAARPTLEVPETGTPVATAHAARLHDSTSDALLREIQEKQAKIPLAPIAVVISIALTTVLIAAKTSLLLLLPVVVFLSVIHAALARRDCEQKLVVLNYEFDSDARARYVSLLKAIQTFASSIRIWRVMSQQTSIDRKYHAGADMLLEKKRVAPRVAAPPWIEAKIAVWAFDLGEQTLYFFPDRLLIYESGQVGAVAYNDLSITIGQVKFREQDDVPADAQVIGHTWQYVNKDGGPDRRFANNRQLPIVLYAETRLCSASGMNIILESSDPQKAITLESGLQAYRHQRSETAQ